MTIKPIKITWHGIKITIGEKYLKQIVRQIVDDVIDWKKIRFELGKYMKPDEADEMVYRLKCYITGDNNGRTKKAE